MHAGFEWVVHISGFSGQGRIRYTHLGLIMPGEVDFSEAGISLHAGSM